MRELSEFDSLGCTPLNKHELSTLPLRLLDVGHLTEMIWFLWRFKILFFVLIIKVSYCVKG